MNSRRDRPCLANRIKARLVLDQIRGKSVGDALATLTFTPSQTGGYTTWSSVTYPAGITVTSPAVAFSVGN